ncbi:hypothetical protein [Sorangium sp. So ce233]|uniref:hypothetical protein n=1 Tax=Sorangium sp. So ce233 TaxID=3133290 RepID=UPI003F5F2BC1
MWVGLLSTACATAPEAEIEVDAPGLEVTALGIPGTNGVPKAAWHAWKLTIASALKHPLMKEGVMNPDIVNVGRPEFGGNEELFGHLLDCTVGEMDGNEGMVIGASSWATQGLDDQVIGSVMECVIAFVNDKNQGVDILISGSAFNATENHPEFFHREAVWCSRIDSTIGGTVLDVSVDVYPTALFARACGIDAKTALEQRYCSEDEKAVANCGLNYGGRLDLSSCTNVGAPGHYECGGKLCTMTWLTDITPDWCQRRRPSPRM